MNTFNEFELNRIKKLYNDELASRLLQRSKSSRGSSARRLPPPATSSLGNHSPSSSMSSSPSLSPLLLANSKPSGASGRQWQARSADRLAASSPSAGVDLNRYQRAFLTKRAPSSSSMRAGGAGSNLQQLRKSLARFGRTLFDFQAKNERELSLKRGDLVEMLELIDHNWARVEDCQSGLQGLVPLSYIDYSVGCAVARRDVSGQQQVSRSCPQAAPLLPMSKGEPITLIRRLSGHWYEASNTRQASGLVWSNDLDIIKQPVLVSGGSGTEDEEEQQHRRRHHRQAATADDEEDEEDEEMLFLDTGERVLASANRRGRSRSGQRRAKSAAATSSRCQCHACSCVLSTGQLQHQHQSNYCCLQQQQQQQQQQQLDGSSRTLQQNTSRHLSEEPLRQPRRSSSSPYISSSAGNQQQQQQQRPLPRLCRAKFAYQPRQKDELELVVGDILMVVHECDDGWFIGTSYTSKETGTFPGNFVEPIS